MGGNYWSTDKDFARQFTQTGRESEVMSGSFRKDAVYEASTIPSAVQGNELEDAISEAKDKGYNALLVDEGADEPNSIFVINPKKTCSRTEGETKERNQRQRPLICREKNGQW